MDIKQQIEQALIRAVEEAVAAGQLPEGGALPPILLEEPPEKELGDFATNFAMQSARVFRQPPQRIAAAIQEHLTGDWLERAEVAGPGFLNLYLKKSVIADTLRAVLAAGETFGTLPPNGAPRIQVEYVTLCFHHMTCLLSLYLLP